MSSEPSHERVNGSNVFNRLLACAKYYKFKYFIRINGDSPFIDFKLIDKLIFIKSKKKIMIFILMFFQNLFLKDNQ